MSTFMGLVLGQVSSRHMEQCDGTYYVPISAVARTCEFKLHKLLPNTISTLGYQIARMDSQVHNVIKQNAISPSSGSKHV